jgi:hypothetical protein
MMQYFLKIIHKANLDGWRLIKTKNLITARYYSMHMNLVLKMSIITLISIIAANTVFSYATAFVDNGGIGSSEICGDGIDNDGDGYIDSEDTQDC